MQEKRSSIGPLHALPCLALPCPVLSYPVCAAPAPPGPARPGPAPPRPLLLPLPAQPSLFNPTTGASYLYHHPYSYPLALPYPTLPYSTLTHPAPPNPTHTIPTPIPPDCQTCFFSAKPGFSLQNLFCSDIPGFLCYTRFIIAKPSFSIDIPGFGRNRRYARFICEKHSFTPKTCDIRCKTRFCSVKPGFSVERVYL